ncbi:MAG TPA: FHA domain-containing protein, partial [Thiotrichales bacterium]|nr:FHA domain-containing protein [Thiotrichales bacterium]
MEIRLLIEDSQGGRSEHRLGPGEHLLGKASECRVPIGDPFASRRHARILVDEEEVYLEDAGSRNGIWQEGNRLSGRTRVRVGDRFRIGETMLLFASPGIEEAGRSDGSHQLEEVRGGDEEVRLSLVRQPVVIDGSVADDEEFHAFKSQVHQLLLEYLDRHKRAVIHTLDDRQLREEATEAVRLVLRENDLELPSGRSDERLVREIVAEAVGLGPLEPLLEDEEVTEIMVNGHRQIYVERRGRLQPIPVVFQSDASLLSIIERIVTPLGRRIDEGSPTVDARLPDGSRVNAVIPPLSLVGPVLTIRKFAKDRLTIDDLVARGSLSREMAEFLAVCVRQRKNIIVSGGTGSGKTTTLNILSNFIPNGERIVTIEDAAELQLHKDHVVRLESRPANVEGRGEVSIRDLVRNALRMRPDRIVVGECRGGEALDMLQAMNTGHDGSLTTGHANSPRD